MTKVLLSCGCCWWWAVLVFFTFLSVQYGGKSYFEIAYSISNSIFAHLVHSPRDGILPHKHNSSNKNNNHQRGRAEQQKEQALSYRAFAKRSKRSQTLSNSQ